VDVRLSRDARRQDHDHANHCDAPVQPDKHAITVYEFNPQGFVTKKTDALNNRIEYVRTSGPETQQVKVFEGGTTLSRTIGFTYKADGRRDTRSVTLPATGETVTETWDYVGRFTSHYQVVSTADLTKIFKTDLDFFFDSGGRPQNIQAVKRRKGDDGSGGDVFVTTQMTYDGNGQVETVVPPAPDPSSPDGLTIRRTYYTAADDAPGASPPLIKNGLLHSIEIDSDSHLSRMFDYDAAGNVAQITDAKGHVTHLAWDGRGRLVRETREIGASSAEWESTLFRYGAPTQTGPTPGKYLLEVETGALGPLGTSAEGRVLRFQRDARGNVLSVERKDSGTYVLRSSYVYDSDDNRIQSTEPAGTQSGTRTLHFAYDMMKRLQSIEDAAHNFTQFQYDAMGNRTQVSEALNGHVTGFVYDALDRLIEVRALGPDPDEITDFAYDAAGNVTKVTDPKLQETDYSYDALSRLESVRQFLGQTTHYRYDDRGRLIRAVDARGPTLKQVYQFWGGLDRVEHYPSETDAINGTLLGRTIAYAYDLEGNVIGASDNDSTLNVAGPLFTVDAATGYDERNRLHEIVFHYLPGGDVTLTSSYNRFGERGQLDLAQGSETLTHTWTYDGQGRLEQASFPGTSPLGFTPFPDDTLQTLARPSGVSTAYSYLPEGPIDTITVTAPGSGQLLRLDYGVNALLNVTSLGEQYTSTDPSQTYAYDYDGANRLQLADYPAAYDLPPDQRYAYDPAGNRDDADTSFAPLSTHAYDADNRLTLSPGYASYSFDDDGNLTSRTGESFTWDAANRLRSFSKAGVSAAYAYDPFGRRIKKTLGGGATTWYLWDGDRLLGEYEGSGRKVRYAYAQGFAPVQVAYKNGTSEDVYDVHSDDLDTPRLLTDSSGLPVWRASYEAFGRAHVSTDPDGSVVTPPPTFDFNIRFPGQYYDAESGLHDNRFRTYDPGTGRYISADPIGLRGGINTYGYVGANPLRWIDRYGLAIGDYPPPPPGYNPNTWTQGQWPNGKYWLQDPEGNKFTVHPEDEGHWRHWDKRDPDNNDQGQCPPNSGKPRDNQEKLKPNQSPVDPNGDAPPWAPRQSLPDAPIIPIIPVDPIPIPIFPEIPIIEPIPVLVP
jgi:RHS repeat-associated protein